MQGNKNCPSQALLLLKLWNLLWFYKSIDSHIWELTTEATLFSFIFSNIFKLVFSSLFLEVTIFGRHLEFQTLNATSISLTVFPPRTRPGVPSSRCGFKPMVFSWVTGDSLPLNPDFSDRKVHRNPVGTLWNEIVIQ